MTPGQGRDAAGLTMTELSELEMLDPEGSGGYRRRSVPRPYQGFKTGCVLISCLTGMRSSSRTSQAAGKRCQRCPLDPGEGGGGPSHLYAHSQLGGRPASLLSSGATPVRLRSCGPGPACGSRVPAHLPSTVPHLQTTPEACAGPGCSGLVWITGHTGGTATAGRSRSRPRPASRRSARRRSWRPVSAGTRAQVRSAD